MDAKWLAWRTRPKVGASAVPVTAQGLFADLVKSALSPDFRALGFKGSGGRYHLASDDCWVMLGLQKSAYSDAAEVQFTVNLMVASKTAWAEMTHLPEKPSPGTLYGAQVSQTRLGPLLPAGEDIWWRVHAEVDLEAVRGAVVEGVRDYAVPWLDGEMSRQGCGRV